ncbi:MAG: efflux RND transporter periplasmic adaptor subunit [Pseudomonadota bacterium]
MLNRTPDLVSIDRRSARRRSLARRLAVGVAIAGVLGGVYWANGATASHNETLLSEEVTRGVIEDVVTATGKILPRAYVDVGAQASGRLDRIHVEIGDQVTAGQLLAEIDPQVQAAKVEADRAELHQLEANLLAQQAEAEFADAQLGRNTKLAPTNAISQATLEEASRNAETASARVEAIRAQIEKMQSTLKSDEALLGFTKIYAPMAGTVVSIDAREGQTLNAAYSTPVIMRIAELGTMTVWTQVSEADVTRLIDGMEVWFTTLGHGDRRWTAKLRQILPAPQKPERPAGQGDAAAAASTASNNVVLYTALFDVDNASGDLRPEMTAQVSFVAARADDVVIAPMAALRFPPLEDGHSHVDVITADGRRVDRGIMTGLRTRFEAQILSGLEPGDRVVTGTRPNHGGSTLLGFRL